MIITFLAFFGFVLLALSVYLLYKNSSNSLSDEKQKQLEDAIKEIEVLHAEIVEKGNHEELLSAKSYYYKFDITNNKCLI